MPRFRKQVLSPRRFWVAQRDDKGAVQYDDQGKPIPVPYDVTAERIRDLYQTQREMLDAGLHIPVPLGHQFAAVPQTLEERTAAKVAHNTGFVVDAELDADGSLWNTVEVSHLPGASSDEEIATRLKKTIKYVSPNITPEFTDGAGRTWKQAITHLALTPTPVYFGQRPFDGVALSMPDLSMISLSTEIDWEAAICTEPPASATVHAAFGTEKGGKAMAFPPKKDDAKPADPKAAEAPKPGGDAPPEAPKPDAQQAAPDGQAGDAAGLKKIIAALAKRGLMVMGATVEQLAVSIETAVATAEASEQKADEKEQQTMQPTTDTGKPGGGTPTPSAPEPQMAMSQADFESLKAENAAQKSMIAALSQDLAQRQAAELIEDVTALEVAGFCEKDVAAKRREAIGAKAMSLVTDDDAELRELRLTIKAEKNIAARVGQKQQAADLTKVHTGPTAMSQAVARPGNQWGPDPKVEREAQEKAGAEMAKMAFSA